MNQILEPLVSVEIVRYTPGGHQNLQDVVATEVPVTVEVWGSQVATLMASPENLDELARGFLVSSGLLQPQELRTVEVDLGLWRVRVVATRPVDAGALARRTYSSGCGKGVVFASSLEEDLPPLPVVWQLEAAEIFAVVPAFRRHSELHEATGGVHSAALVRDGQLVVVRDDVGRHNAVDKVIGWALAREYPLDTCWLVTTGRIAVEIVHKCRRVGLPIIVSLGAATHQAVLVGRRFHLTVVAFARQGRFSVWATPQRIGSGILPGETRAGSGSGGPGE